VVVVGGPEDVGERIDRQSILVRAEPPLFWVMYDILKAEALAPRASIDLVRKAIQTWT
jgi:hypothetical protein